MTYGVMARRLEEFRARSEALPLEARPFDLCVGLAGLAMVLGAYGDGWREAGGDMDTLQTRGMDEVYVVEVNHLDQYIRAAERRDLPAPQYGERP